ncbi:hypothetical protein GCM10023168_23740 [Fodinibacter luteus]|uniref:DUF2568 domain-containing protein n=1 Tax=Fodinibacter luteus TaxID=552064 RepID=A0ABP8KJF3_9MICO
MSSTPPERPTPGHGADLMSTPSLLALAVVAFVVELALFGGVGAIAYAAVGGGLAGWGAAIGATALVLLLWGLLMAPKARWRLGTGARVLVAAALCLGTAFGLVDAGWPAWGWFVGVAGLAVVAAQVVLPTAGDGPRTAEADARRS